MQKYENLLLCAKQNSTIQQFLLFLQVKIILRVVGPHVYHKHLKL
jgi:hypothetical protein